METHIQKWGNSLGLRIPNQVIKQLQLHAGSAVNIEIEDGRIIIETPKYDLDTMLKGITPKNLHHLKLDDEQQLGNEAW
ncbi:MAG: AbrB/MazE/SpoVT family DNA-binding domain-containing protein [Candidatus Protochlamydia sp.]|nr:AbrB/MazE/SpoVT family DNA-binding domain-containing protein [Candidatus Protochlamydia sp.]